MFDMLTIGLGVALIASMKKKHDNRHGIMTPERQEMFNSAMEKLASGEKLMKLAKAFEENGLHVQANLLRRRAIWRNRNVQQREQHDEVFNKAMESTNVQAILKVAASFEGMTATQKAAALRAHAQLVQQKQKAANSIPRNTAPTPPQPDVVEAPVTEVVDVPAEG